MKVSLDPNLRDRVAANDVLFVFARAVNGSRMPLAVIRMKASDLPRSFTLDDSMAMTPSIEAVDRRRHRRRGARLQIGQRDPVPG